MNVMVILCTLFVYLCLLFGVSYWTSRGKEQVDNNDTFFRAGKSSPWYAVAFGMIGASVSGVSFVSVPGMPRTMGMTYLQTCMGFILGYVVVAYGLLPLYYRLGVTSIYTYLYKRFSLSAYRTGAGFFLLSKLCGTAVKLYLVCMILHSFLFADMGIPFMATVPLVIFVIWAYTQRGGIRTLVWTDCVQTFVMLSTLIILLVVVAARMGLDVYGVLDLVCASPYGRVFVWDDWLSNEHFVKQFVSGIFIVIVMTGLDQDMMQKNLTCKTLRESQRNMCSYGLAFLPVNALFLVLGVLLLQYSSQCGIVLPEKGDLILPKLCCDGTLGVWVSGIFTLGILAAAFSSADSALTSLTTSCCVDVLRISEQIHVRRYVHALFAVLLTGLVWVFALVNQTSVIDAVYVLVSYTYGPLLGLFSFGLFTHRNPRPLWVPVVCIVSPIICWCLEVGVETLTGYRFGYELLMLNGAITFIGLGLCSFKR